MLRPLNSFFIIFPDSFRGLEIAVGSCWLSKGFSAQGASGSRFHTYTLPPSPRHPSPCPCEVHCPRPGAEELPSPVSTEYSTGLLEPRRGSKRETIGKRSTVGQHWPRGRSIAGGGGVLLLRRERRRRARQRIRPGVHLLPGSMDPACESRTDSLTLAVYKCIYVCTSVTALADARV